MPGYRSTMRIRETGRRISVKAPTPKHAYEQALSEIAAPHGRLVTADHLSKGDA